MRQKFAPVALLVIGSALAALVAPARAEDAVGLITEIKLNRGDVQIRLPGKNWQKPAPLQSSRNGPLMPGGSTKPAGTEPVTV